MQLNHDRKLNTKELMYIFLDTETLGERKLSWFKVIQCYQIQDGVLVAKFKFKSLMFEFLPIQSTFVA